MFNSVKLYVFIFIETIKELIFGKEEEVYPETQDDYMGGQCFYDPKTGKHECE